MHVGLTGSEGKGEKERGKGGVLGELHTILRSYLTFLECEVFGKWVCFIRFHSALSYVFEGLSLLLPSER